MPRTDLKKTMFQQILRVAFFRFARPLLNIFFLRKFVDIFSIFPQYLWKFRRIVLVIIEVKLFSMYYFGNESYHFTIPWHNNYITCQIVKLT